MKKLIEKVLTGIFCVLGFCTLVVWSIWDRIKNIFIR
jgi:TRAP-type mannitol/chloroaromatic compound transport system permease small subunit